MISQWSSKAPGAYEINCMNKDFLVVFFIFVKTV